MRAQADRRLPWLLAGASIVLMAVGTVLNLIYIARSGNLQPVLSHQGLIPAATLTYAALGALVAARHPRNPIGWLLLSTAVLLGLNAADLGYWNLQTLFPARHLPGSDLALSFGRWGWIPGGVLPIMVLAFFPDGRLPSRWWRLLIWGTALGLVGTVVSVILYPGPVVAWDIPGPNPFGISGLAPILDVVFNISGGLLAIGLLGALVALAVRFRRSRGVERQQMKWVVYATAVLFGLATLTWTLAGSFMSEAAAEELGIVLTDLLILGIAVSVSIAVLRYRLYDIDLVINRTLVYGALTASVAAMYVLVVGGLGVLLQARGSLELSLVGVGMVAIVAQPVRDRLQRAVNRLMYGERDDPYAVLSRLGRQLEGVLAPDAVLPAIVETVAQALKLPYAAITLRQDESFTAVAEYGRAPAEVLHLPLAFQGETIGQLVLAPRAPGEAFSPADRRLLDDLARQAGAAAHAVALTLALQRSRQRLVTAREEERRRLRRDLHDGLGPRLASLTLRLETAQNRLADHPEAQALLADLPAQATAAVADIRRLVYALRPPALDELGLISALRETAAQYAAAVPNGLAVAIEAPEQLPALPAAVEVAAFRIIQEALVNVVRHSGACHCRIRLCWDEAGGWLALSVEDDGRGLPAQRRAGVGLTSMRERADELGGLWAIGALEPGGTCVRAQLPCRPAEAGASLSLAGAAVPFGEA